MKTLLSIAVGLMILLSGTIVQAYYAYVKNVSNLNLVGNVYLSDCHGKFLAGYFGSSGDPITAAGGSRCYGAATSSHSCRKVRFKSVGGFQGQTICGSTTLNQNQNIFILFEGGHQNTVTCTMRSYTGILPKCI